MSDLDALRKDWTVDDRASLGRKIFEAVSYYQRPDWVGGILLFTAGEKFTCPEIARVVEISIDDRFWIEGHKAFQAVRQLTLVNERNSLSGSRQQLVLDIAETAAKVIYNTSGGSAPFDADAGWFMASRLRRLVEDVKDAEFEEDCWHLLIRKRRTGPSRIEHRPSMKRWFTDLAMRLRK